MHLSQKTPYLSIKHFQEADLPSFVVLTGVNGAGKTHLLRAIQQGHVVPDITADIKEIRYYDWSELVPSSAPRVSIQEVYGHENWIFDAIRGSRDELSPGLRNTLSRIGLDERFSYQPWRATSLAIPELEQILGTNEKAVTAKNELDRHKNELTSRVNARVNQSNDRIKQSMFGDLINDQGNLWTISDNYYSSRPFRWRSESMFQHNFSQLFLAYFDKVKNNKLRLLDEGRGVETDQRSLSEAEFVARHGQPPWDFVNQTMARANLDFEIDHPISYESNQYQAVLRKISTNTEVDFAALSSGERVLMSFAFCLYHSIDTRQEIKRPKILLFDEIDAPLHPSMSKTLVQTIEQVLVREHGIPVILATHSPSTVAVAPEGSVYLLDRLENKLTAESKRRAVSTLTAEIPTMSIDFSGRRQVFVESDFDADRYAELYQIVAPSLETERSLSFIGVGRRAEAITGCAQVISTVTDLTNSGNISVFGLIDWDQKNVATPRIKVLGDGERYAIENYLLDPLLVAAAVLNEDPSATEILGLDRSATYASFSDATAASHQAAISSVQNSVLAQLQLFGAGVAVMVDYQGGYAREIDQRYLLTNGHDLEAATLTCFPKLLRYQGAGKLLMHMVKVIARNHPALVPRTLVASLRWLCEVEVA